MATELIATVKMSNVQHIGRTWRMCVETTSEIHWNVTDQVWDVTYTAWAAINDEVSQDLHEFAVNNESVLLESIGISPTSLLAQKTGSNVMRFSTPRYEDLVISYGWYKFRYVGTLSCTFIRGEHVFRLQGADKDTFLRIMATDCRDMVFMETMQKAKVTRLDLWRLVFSSPFVKYNDISASFLGQIHPMSDASDSCILERVACMASRLPTFAQFLKFLHTTRIVYLTNAKTYVRYGRAIYKLQEAVKRYVWRPESALVLTKILGDVDEHHGLALTSCPGCVGVSSKERERTLQPGPAPV